MVKLDKNKFSIKTTVKNKQSEIKNIHDFDSSLLVKIKSDSEEEEETPNDKFIAKKYK